jgi:hypothetical protein
MCSFVISCRSWGKSKMWGKSDVARKVPKEFGHSSAEVNSNNKAEVPAAHMSRLATIQDLNP